VLLQLFTSKFNLSSAVSVSSHFITPFKIFTITLIPPIINWMKNISLYFQQSGSQSEGYGIKIGVI